MCIRCLNNENNTKKNRLLQKAKLNMVTFYINSGYREKHQSRAKYQKIVNAYRIKVSKKIVI